jgi:hypothetical protein
MRYTGSMEIENDMTTLSPAAQAVLDAFTANWQDEPLAQDRQCLAAALRAVADQVSPEHYLCYTGDGTFDFGMEARNEAIREEILSIAAELEGA